MKTDESYIDIKCACKDVDCKKFMRVWDDRFVAEHGEGKIEISVSNKEGILQSSIIIEKSSLVKIVGGERK